MARSWAFGRGGVGEADRGDPDGVAGPDDLGGDLVAEPVVGREPDPKGLPVEDRVVASEPVGEGLEVGQGGAGELEGFQVAELVGLGPDQVVVLQVEFRAAGV